MTRQALTAEQLAVYREGLRRRLETSLASDEQATLDAARCEARQAAERLVQQFGVRRVILFGSVARAAAIE